MLSNPSSAQPKYEAEVTEEFAYPDLKLTEKRRGVLYGV